MPFGKLNLRPSKSKVEKLLDRVRTREITVDDLMSFHEWAQVARQYPSRDWCKDFGTFKAVGTGLELDTFLNKEQPCWGERLDDRPRR
jgi:hypothetical protein